MRRTALIVLALLLPACSSKKDTTGSIPGPADAMVGNVKTGLNLMFPGIGRLDAILPFVLSPGSPEAAGIEFTLVSPPFTYDFRIPLDGDSDGLKETTITGRATFNGDPASAGPGFGGHIDLDVQSVGGLGNFAGSLDFERTGDGTLMSGSGVFTEKIMGETTAISVDPGSPLLSRPATGATNSVANACAYSLDGTIGLIVTAASGASFASNMDFDPSRRDVEIRNGVYTDGKGASTDVGDVSYEIPCGSGSINDWTGVFLQNWSCLPPETGSARLTITVIGSNRIRITDEDPPGSGDTNIYEATMVSGNPHLVRGFFISGAAGTTYREDFSWTLSANRNVFTQISAYAYQEGPLQGTGGLCAATARRQ